mgnify:CR=1 FL=1
MVDQSRVVRVTRDFEPRPVIELWAWIVEEQGGEGVAACEMTIDGHRFMMPLVGADEERVRSLEPYARAVENITGLKVKLKRFSQVSDA